MDVPFFDLKLQNLQIKEKAAKKISEVFDSGAFILGHEVSDFEKNIAKYLKTKHAIGISSGTDAILVALMALGVGEGDEVICPSFTFFATAGCIARLGAYPVFADTNLDDFNISVADITKKITSKTKAIIPVHLFGQTALIDEILKIGTKFNIPIVEDCAQSLGATRLGRQSGTFGKIGCFSFFPTKNLGGFGDAGLVCTDDDAVAEKMRVLRTHGMKPQYFHKHIGGNFRIDELQAALLNLKLPYVNDYISNRRRNAEIYLDALSECEQIALPKEINENFHTWNQFTIRILGNIRNLALEKLRTRGIGCNVYYPLPLDRQECFERYIIKNDLTHNAFIASQEVLSLPIFPELKVEQIHHVAKILKNILSTL